MTEPTILSAQGLEVRYAREQAVRGIDLSVERGEVLGLIGPDGAGKTSTIRVLAGLQRATTGTVTAFGRPCWQQRRALQRRLGYLAQRFALYTDLTVFENIRFFAMLHGVPKWKARRDALLDRVGLAPFGHRIVDKLSGGMKQKLALACTLMHSPEILLLDEPTTGVDPVTRREFWRLLGELVADGLTLVVATPYLDEAERCTRVVLLHRGSVLVDAPPAGIPDCIPGRMFEITATPRALAERTLRDIPEIVDVVVFGATLHVRGNSGLEVEALAETLRSCGVTVTTIRDMRPGLEDAFLFLTRDRVFAEAS